MIAVANKFQKEVFGVFLENVFDKQQFDWSSDLSLEDMPHLFLLIIYALQFLLGKACQSHNLLQPLLPPKFFNSLFHRNPTVLQSLPLGTHLKSFTSCIKIDSIIIDNVSAMLCFMASTNSLSSQQRKCRWCSTPLGMVRMRLYKGRDLMS